MASWTNDSELAPVARGFVADLRDLVANWRAFAAGLVERLDPPGSGSHYDIAARDRVKAVADAYRHCADELDRRIILDDGEDE